ncbi:EAL domain protein [compost metagenome]
MAIDLAALEGTMSRRFLEALAQRGTHLVARGIESPANVEAARAAGVELLQGFHLGRP